MPVHGFSKGKCNLLPEHHDLKQHCSRLHLLNFNIHAYMLCAGVLRINFKDNNNNNASISISQNKLSSAALTALPTNIQVPVSK